MSKKKKKNKHSKKLVQKSNVKQARQSSGEVRLSQCMIVKNEEKHIEKALEWAKPIAYEQIVVDTGSTDKTVEIAESMGAKIYHFKWIDDFSAAKNFAIEQATGNWIAFLDADEHMSPGDVNKLMKKLNEVEQNRESGKNITIIKTPMVDLDDEGNATGVFLHSRIYRNIKEIRYSGRIHESITAYGESLTADDISIIHTGYSESEHKEKNKTDRNIKLLRKELESSPDSMLIKAYLADSLKAKNLISDKPDKKEESEVSGLFNEVIESNEQLPEFLIKKAYLYHIGQVWNKDDKKQQCEELCKAGHEKLPDDLDLGYYYSALLNEKKNFKGAWEILSRLKSKFTTGTGHISGATAKVQSDPNMIFGQMLMAAQGLGDIESTITYATLLLMSNKIQPEILGPYIYALLKHDTSKEDILELLAKIYDLTSPADLLLIARAAKDAGAVEFAGFILNIAKEYMG